MKYLTKFLSLIVRFAIKIFQTLLSLIKQLSEYLNQQVNQLYSEGKFNEAILVAEQALILAKSLHPGDHPDVATSLNNLAALYESQGRYEKAEPLFQQALEMTKRLFKGDHPDVATSLNNLAALYNSQGRYEKAEPLYLKSLEMISSHAKLIA